MLPIARIIKFYKLSTLGYTGLILLLLTLCSCSREQLDSARLKIFLNQGSNLVGVTKDSLFEYYNSYGITLTDNWRNYSLPDSILKESYTFTFNGSDRVARRRPRGPHHGRRGGPGPAAFARGRPARGHDRGRLAHLPGTRAGFHRAGQAC